MYSSIVSVFPTVVEAATCFNHKKSLKEAILENVYQFKCMLYFYLHNQTALKLEPLSNV